ncbi:MAG TPA: hypothetical protein VNA66_10360, partial [Gammaproteobacteria bacterium]|nr:hypothetical protein [Gammaproteobacteria bacterium]
MNANQFNMLRLSAGCYGAQRIRSRRRRSSERASLSKGWQRARTAASADGRHASRIPNRTADESAGALRKWRPHG